MTRYIIRASLRQTPSIAALGRLLLPDDSSGRVNAEHRLVWSLFAGAPDRRRDFLWRSERSGQFLILAPTEPAVSEVLEIEIKKFDPALAAGDRLQFRLRANATRSHRDKADQRGVRGKRADIVMSALHPLPRAARPVARSAVIESAGGAWLDRQAERSGFRLLGKPFVDSYQMLRIPRGDRTIAIGMLDFEGLLEVTEPNLFLQSLYHGFGRAKAFGGGLMLIRRN